MNTEYLYHYRIPLSSKSFYGLRWVFPDQLIVKKLWKERRWNKKKLVDGSAVTQATPPAGLLLFRLTEPVWRIFKTWVGNCSIIPLPYPELQRDYRFNVKLAGSLIASPIGIKVHTVSPPKRGVAISHHSTGVSCQSCLNFSMARPRWQRLQSGRTVESVWKKFIIVHTVGQKIKESPGQKKTCEIK